ncbi:unnamed protein product, partial [Discosporangium mesarthrocarpum]
QASRTFLCRLTTRLIALHGSKDFQIGSVSNNAAYGRKLRAWQALCVLCGYLCENDSRPPSAHIISKLIHEVDRWIWVEARRPALPPIRQHMEVFKVRMCLAYPAIFMRGLVKELENPIQKGQVLCSLLIVAGHVLLRGGEGVLPYSEQMRLFKACLPWLVGSHAIARITSQIIAYRLLPKAIAEVKRSCGSLRAIETEITERSGWSELSFLEGLFLFLDENPDMTKMRNKQSQAFQAVDFEALCTVPGMLEAHGIDAKGEVTATHLTDLIQEAMEELWQEAERETGRRAERGRAWDKVVAKINDGTWFEAEGVLSEPANGDPQHIQQKILPWDSLDLTVGAVRKMSLRSSTAIGRARQHVVVCATLLEKVAFPQKCVLVLGAEYMGIPVSLIDEMDFCVQIPQMGVLRSLNAHVSGAMVLWEYTRQRLV